MTGIKLRDRSKPTPAPATPAIAPDKKPAAPALGAVATKALSAVKEVKDPGVKELGAKERIQTYISAAQKKKLRFLAADRGRTMSEIIGALIDEAPLSI